MTIGVVVQPRQVSVVVVDGRVTIHSVCVPVADAVGADGVAAHVSTALSAALERLPRTRWAPPRVQVALGEPFARVKTVRGVPPVRRRRELLALLRLNLTRYVAHLSPVLLTGARVTSQREVEIGFADRALVDAITSEIERLRLRVGCIAPVAALGPERTSAAEVSEEEHAAGDSDLATCAARVRTTNLLVLPPRGNPARVRAPVSRTRIGLACGALMFVVVAASYVRVRETRSRLATLQLEERRVAPLADSAMADLRALSGLNGSIAATAEFSRQRLSTVMLLSTLANALPSGVAITTVHVDTASVDIVTLAPRTADVVDALSDVPGVEAPAIIGPVSRDAIGAATLERATIRLRLVRSAMIGVTPFAVERDRSTE